MLGNENVGFFGLMSRGYLGFLFFVCLSACMCSLESFCSSSFLWLWFVILFVNVSPYTVAVFLVWFLGLQVFSQFWVCGGNVVSRSFGFVCS